MISSLGLLHFLQAFSWASVTSKNLPPSGTVSSSGIPPHVKAPVSQVTNLWTHWIVSLLHLPIAYFLYIFKQVNQNYGLNIQNVLNVSAPTLNAKSLLIYRGGIWDLGVCSTD